MGDKRQNSGLIANILRVLSANFWVAIIGFIGSFVFPKILSIDDYALYHSFTLYLTYITILHLGFPSGMVINYAGKSYTSIDNNKYKTEIIIVSSILLFFTLFFILLSFLFDSKMLLYVALAIIPYDLVGSYKALLQAWSRFKSFSVISTVIATTIPLCAIIYYFLNSELPGDVYICIFLGIYWAVASIIIAEIFRKIKGAKSKPICSIENWNTEKTGLILVLGNYINTLFVSADKQFIKWFFDNSKFAFYSFGMSMQALMTVFITSIAQPLFPAMAQGRFEDKDYNKIKELLIIFGSFSGCAYFITSIIVKSFISKYTDSLNVVGIYFVVFPALAVVNCLYLNLYKIKNMMRTYIKTIIGILCIAVVLNAVAVSIYPKFTGVSIATTITYYIWFVVGIIQFKFIKLTLKDVAYLLIYTIGFFLITRNINDFIGIPVYFCFIVAIILLFYRNDIKILLKMIRR